MRDWSIMTQSETPSSRPTLSPKPARVRVLTYSSSVSSCREPLHLTVPIAPFLLVDLADARLWNAIDEQDLLGDAVFRDGAIVGERLEMILDDGLAGAVCAGLALDHEGKRPLAPFVVLN